MERISIDVKTEYEREEISYLYNGNCVVGVERKHNKRFDDDIYSHRY